MRGGTSGPGPALRLGTLGLCLLAPAPQALVSTGLISQAAAQQPRGGRPSQKAPDKEPPAPAPAPDLPAPYDRDLMRLSEIIGSLAFLRGLCAAPDAVEWSGRMKALIDAEGITPARRDRLAGAFNRGYRSYAVTYRVCTPSAQEAASRFVAEGERLSHTLAGRFGG